MTTPSLKDARSALFADPNFRWLMSGSIISMLGDQFTLIALPWLVLKLTGDPFALGMTLATMSVPRAIFILIGGAVVDRYSAKRVFMLTKQLSVLLLGLLAVLVFAGNPPLWAVNCLALAMGLATAFSIPSGTTILAQVVRRDQLPAANSMLMGLRQVSLFAGPLLAGILVAVLGDGKTAAVTDARGLGTAFAFDAFSFAFSAWTLGRVRTQAQPGPAPGQPPQGILHSVGEGLRYCWNDHSLRICFLYWMAVTLLVSGPIQVAMPVLATSLGDSAATLGLLAGSYGAGTLAGMLGSGAKPGLRLRSFGFTMLVADGAVGLLFLVMSQARASWQDAMILLTIGLVSGYLQVMVYSWIQSRVPSALLGRVMSLFMFIFMGVAPLSSALAGMVMRTVPVSWLFAGCGALLTGLAMAALCFSPIAAVSDAPR